MSEFNWTCRYCQRDQTVSAEKHHDAVHRVDVGDVSPRVVCLHIDAIGCSNPDCKKITLAVSVRNNLQYNVNYLAHPGDIITHHTLWPESSHNPQPTYIPDVIVQDYKDACRIRDLSPKASATLSRRCIQGIIRDFCKISGKTLYGEIETLKTQVEDNKAPPGVSIESVEAIHHVREIGNIGAHMEKDINVIIDVDENEAQALIELIELLFEDWYVARNSRQEKLAKVQLIGLAKAEQKKSAAPILNTDI